jgi:SNF2 family DNA or RNA helicase
VWGLTGTPIPNEPTDAWAQIKLVDPTKVPKYFGRFRDMTMNKITQYKYTARRDALEIVHAHMQPAIRYSRADCVDLPPTLYQTRHIDLTPGQKKMYEALRQQMKSEEDAGTVRAVNEADKLMKLVQVAAGAVYTTEGETVHLDNSARMREVIEIIEQAKGKVIVYVPFIAALKQVRELLAEQFPTELVYGGTSKAERDLAFWRFQELPIGESRVLVANARAMSHGITLTAADTIVWMAPHVSHETFDQANHRIIRPGQLRNTLIVMIEGTPVERQIYKRLQERQSMQGLFLEAVRSTPSDV